MKLMAKDPVRVDVVDRATDGISGQMTILPGVAVVDVEVSDSYAWGTIEGTGVSIEWDVVPSRIDEHWVAA